MASAFKALSNPQRLRIFLKLAAGPLSGNCCKEDGSNFGCCVGDLGNGLEISSSTVSHHLKELRQAGLMRMERKGRHIECHVDEAVLTRLSAFFESGAVLRGKSR